MSRFSCSFLLPCQYAICEKCHYSQNAQSRADTGIQRQKRTFRAVDLYDAGDAAAAGVGGDPAVPQPSRCGSGIAFQKKRTAVRRTADTGIKDTYTENIPRDCTAHRPCRTGDRKRLRSHRQCGSVCGCAQHYPKYTMSLTLLSLMLLPLVVGLLTTEPQKTMVDEPPPSRL